MCQKGPQPGPSGPPTHAQSLRSRVCGLHKAARLTSWAGPHLPGKELRPCHAIPGLGDTGKEQGSLSPQWWAGKRG